ncbi:MAG: O-antigen ligase family protein [Deltaproteobacteria bacterium]|nr:O-antigen ligase family protein [Deltaproteobacteria bacterium]MBW2069539.1 O-antigen ligase family protein [Deltaproteobacteria bacterium]
MTLSLRGFENLALPIVLGCIAALGGIILVSLPFKFAVTTLLILCMSIILMTFPGYAKNIIYFSMVFFISVNLDINFWVHKHVGSASSISISISWLSSSVLMLLLLRDRLLNQRKLRISGELLVLFLYALWGCTGFLRAEYPEYVLLELVRLMMGGVILFVVSNELDESLLGKLVTFLLLAVLFQGLLALIQYVFQSVPTVKLFGMTKVKELFPGQVVHRAMGTLGHPNFLGYFLELTLPLCFVCMFNLPSGFSRKIAGLAWLVGTLAIVATKSRGAWVGYTMAMLFIMALQFRKFLWGIRPVVRLLTVVLLVVLILAGSYPVIKKRLLGSDHRSASVRMPLNKAAVSILRQFPVAGVGMNNFSESFKKYDTTGYSRIFRGYKHVVHNLYLLIAVETGLIGLSLFLLFLSFPFYHALRLCCYDYRGLGCDIVGGICGGVWGHLVHGLFDPGFVLSPQISTLIFFMIGLVSAYSRILIYKSREV